MDRAVSAIKNEIPLIRLNKWWAFYWPDAMHGEMMGSSTSLDFRGIFNYWLLEKGAIVLRDHEPIHKALGY